MTKRLSKFDKMNALGASMTFFIAGTGDRVEHDKITGHVVFVAPRDEGDCPPGKLCVGQGHNGTLFLDSEQGAALAKILTDIFGS